MRRLLAGQTLIELLVAMTVIIVGLVTATTMIFYNSRLQERSALRVVAINLAREGIEYAKAQRDSNWLAGQSFDDGLYDPATLDYTAVPLTDGGMFDGFDFTPSAAFIFGGPVPPEVVLYRSTNAGSLGLFVQGSGATGDPTKYLRILVFQPICADGTIVQSDGSDCGAQEKIGIHLISAVGWEFRNVSQNTVVEDDLYDWR